MILPVVAMVAAQSVAQPSADRYAGYYRLAPHKILRIWREGDRWYGQLTGQVRVEIVAKGDGVFTLVGVAAELAFTVDARSDVTGLTLKQSGLELPAPRIDEATAVIADPGLIGRAIPKTWTERLAGPPRRLAEGPGSDYWPCFSPDGRSVLFAHTTDGRTWTLMRVPADGGTAQPVAGVPSSVSATRPNWSTTGLVAFTGTSGGRDQVWIMGPNGDDARPLTAPGLSDHAVYPSWYPDGRRLAVLDAGDSVIRRIDLDGGPAVALTDRAQVLAGMPSVSPDGRWVAFAGQKNLGQSYDQGNNVIWLVGPDGKAKTLEATPQQGRAPVWSPDGSHLAFESGRGGPDGRYAVFVVARDGTGLSQVTPYALNATHPLWSPDGKRMVMAVQSGPDTRVVVVELPDG